jgi:antagonist of KipI
MRAYLCVPGGFVSPRILDSRSSLEPIQAGQTLVCTPSSLPSRFLADSANVTLPAQFPCVLRVLPGSQAEWFARDTISSRIFTVSGDSNRMGLRLKGEPIARPQREMISEPVCPGVIQVANDGQCIILGVDGQTIGGYPKIAQVIRADLDYLGQLRPGDAIRFVPIDLAKAEEADRQRMAELRQWLTRLAVAVN